MGNGKLAFIEHIAKRTMNEMNETLDQEFGPINIVGIVGNTFCYNVSLFSIDFYPFYDIDQYEYNLDVSVHHIYEVIYIW